MFSFRSLVLGALLLSAGPVLAQAPAAPATPPPTPMGLTSSSFTDGGIIPDKYTQASPSPISPQLAWTNPPAGTQSFTLIMHDPDTAPGKSSTDILHWIAFNIPPTVTSLPEGVPNEATLPDGTIQPNARNGKPGFMGPGARGNVYHHYTWELYALDIKLPFTAAATRDEILKAMDGYVIGKAVVTGRFHRPL